MSDVLIRDIPDDVLAVLDQLAARMGLSRTTAHKRYTEATSPNST
jgi:hypothetical protein